MAFTTAISRPLQLVTRALQWSSAVIAMGLTSYFIAKGPHGQHIIYQEVIVCLGICCLPQNLQILIVSLGCLVCSFLPPGIYLPIPSNCSEQICSPDRRDILVPV